jgi:hypothetical protein
MRCNFTLFESLVQCNNTPDGPSTRQTRPDLVLPRRSCEVAHYHQLHALLLALQKALLCNVSRRNGQRKLECHSMAAAYSRILAFETYTTDSMFVSVVGSFRVQH